MPLSSRPTSPPFADQAGDPRWAFWTVGLQSSPASVAEIGALHIVVNNAGIAAEVAEDEHDGLGPQNIAPLVAYLASEKC